MIKLFNKTRKKLLDENKTGRYLKYAIGEIVLVMIGILLALQVNTWNNNRELKKEEQKVLKSLFKEFNENLIKFDKIYNDHLVRKKAMETAMSFEPRDVTLDSLSSLIVRINQNSTYDPYQGIYNSVINSGKIELISNDILKNKISKIQDLTLDYQEGEIGAQDFAKDNLYPFLMKQQLVDFNFELGNNEITEESISLKESYIKIIESAEYNNLLKFSRGWMKDIFREGPILREEIVSIINLLESEIKKHEN